MFTIYGISGPVFQGSLESLSKLPPVVRRGPVNVVRRLNAQDATYLTGDQLLEANPSGNGTQAIEAYKAMLPKELDRGPLLHANQIMQTRVITLNAGDDVARAWQILVNNQIHQAPVLDAGLRLTGIVSERNLLTTLNVADGQVRDVLHKKVLDVMTTPVVAATPLTDIRRIARVMLDRDVDGVPITSESGALIGFISRSDILRAVVTDPPLSIWR
jgi:acetoin utilization protein AcuB